MTDLTPENVQELATIVRENSGGAITEESEHIHTTLGHMSLGADRLDIVGPGWYLSVVASPNEGGLEHARMALVSLAGGLGKLLASGEYEENILRSQGKTHEAGIAKLRREHHQAIQDYVKNNCIDERWQLGYADGLRKALEAMGEHAE